MRNCCQAETSGYDSKALICSSKHQLTETCLHVAQLAVLVWNLLQIQLLYFQMGCHCSSHHEEFAQMFQSHVDDTLALRVIPNNERSPSNQVSSWRLCCYITRRILVNHNWDFELGMRCATSWQQHSCNLGSNCKRYLCLWSDKWQKCPMNNVLQINK